MRRRLPIVASLYLVLAGAIGLGIGSQNIPHYSRLARDGRMVMGTVAKTDCSSHNQVDYTYRVGDDDHSGSRGRSDCGKLVAGQQIEVWYLPDEPATSDLREPTSGLRNEWIAV